MRPVIYPSLEEGAFDIDCINSIETDVRHTVIRQLRVP